MANQAYDSYRQMMALGIAPDWLTDTIEAVLVSSSYTPNYATDASLSNLGANVVGSAVQLAGIAVSNGQVTANATTFPAVASGSTVDYIAIYKNTGAATAWAASTAYSAGTVIQDSNGNLQKCVTAGSSGSAAPTWNTTYNGATTDGTVSWLNIGPNNPLMVLFDSASGSPGLPVTSNGGDIDVTWGSPLFQP